jgi:hypothetical protein
MEFVKFNNEIRLCPRITDTAIFCCSFEHEHATENSFSFLFFFVSLHCLFLHKLGHASLLTYRYGTEFPFAVFLFILLWDSRSTNFLLFFMFLCFIFGNERGHRNFLHLFMNVATSNIWLAIGGPHQRQLFLVPSYTDPTKMSVLSLTAICWAANAVNRRFLPATKKRSLRQTKWVKLIISCFLFLQHQRGIKAILKHVRFVHEQPPLSRILASTSQCLSFSTKPGGRLPFFQQHATVPLRVYDTLPYCSTIYV